MLEFVADTEHPVTIPCGPVNLNGLLHIPHSVNGAVIFVHGSGCSRLNPRNQSMAKAFQQLKWATLLFDLLTDEEEAHDNETKAFRYDIDLLTTRLTTTTAWLMDNPVLHKLPLGYLGANTGVAAALAAAAKNQKTIKAVVSRGGRPDLAQASVTEVRAATLFIVGGEDDQVIAYNKKAYSQLRGVKNLAVIEGATHLFEEADKLEEMTHLAGNWFKEYLV